MSTGRGTQLTKQIGEYLVAAELCRRNLITTTFTGNVPQFDIVALEEDHTSLTIQVKTIRGNSSWQFNAARFLDIEISEEGIQEVKRKVPLLHPNMIYVFVQLIDTGKDNFYLLQESDLQNIIYERYCANLRAKEGRRPRNPQSTHCAIWPDTLHKYKDNWDLVNEELERIRNKKS